MENENAKNVMISAIHEQTQERIQQLLQEAQKEKERLKTELETKMMQAQQDNAKELEQITLRLQQQADSQLQAEKRRLSIENHYRISEQILANVYKRLETLMQGLAYREQLQRWILEAIEVVASNQVYLRLGQQDLSYWDETMEQEVVTYAKNQLGLTLVLSLHPDGIHRGRGPVVTSQDGRRLCDNTMDARFTREKAQLNRMIAAQLF